MPERLRFPAEAWPLLVAGSSWLWVAPTQGFFIAAVGAVPGCLLVGSGAALLLWPGDARITHFGAMGGVLGCLLALASVFSLGIGAALALFVLSAAGFVACGGHAHRFEPDSEGVPVARPSLALSARVGANEALLASMVAFMPFPGRSETRRIAGEVAAAREMFGGKGCSSAPREYHATPPPLEQPRLRSARIHGVDFDCRSIAASSSARSRIGWCRPRRPGICGGTGTSREPSGILAPTSRSGRIAVCAR